MVPLAEALMMGLVCGVPSPFSDFVSPGQSPTRSEISLSSLAMTLSKPLVECSKGLIIQTLRVPSFVFYVIVVIKEEFSSSEN
mmetsp:Transcript_22087/g.50960  ORF Transcript_22087/g.50960 Transcript_22087/m.50960 type:complete len:83 (+) Transcript_22087:712-960(+)